MDRRLLLQIAQYAFAAIALVVLAWLSWTLVTHSPQTAPTQVASGDGFVLVTPRPTSEPTPTYEFSDWSFVVTPTPAPDATADPNVEYVYVPITPVDEAYPPARSRSGFHFGGQVLDFGQNAVEKMHYAGMQWVKFQVHVGDLDVAEKVNRAHARGFKALVGIMGDPAQVTNPAYHAVFAEFAGSVAAAGADAIEIWNEPNIARDWPAGEISAATYAALVKPSYLAAKAANPNVLVISSGLAPTLVSESLKTANFWTEVDFTTEFVAAGGLNYVDCMGIHYNIGITPPTWRDDERTGDAAFFFYPQLLEHYERVTQGRRPVCFTEFGILTDEGFQPLAEAAPDFIWAQNTTLADQGEWLAQAVSMARYDPQVEMIIVWNVDFWHYGRDPHAGYAIIRQDGSCPSCETLRAVMGGN